MYVCRLSGLGESKNCCLVRANYPDNLLQFFSSMSKSLDKKQSTATQDGDGHLTSSLQTSGAPTLARTQELGCAVESGTEGQRCEELETRSRRRPQESELAGLGFRVALLAQGSVSWATGECLWDSSTIFSVIFKLRLFHIIAKFRDISLLKIGNRG